MFRCGVLQSRLPSADVVLVKTNAPCHRWLVWCMRSSWYSRCSPYLTRTEMRWTLEHQTFVTQVLQMCISCRSCTVLERRTRCTYKALWVERKKQSITMVVCLCATPTCWTLYHVAPESLWLQNPFIVQATKKDWHRFPPYSLQVALVWFSFGILSFFACFSITHAWRLWQRRFF